MAPMLGRWHQTALAIAGIILPRLAFIGGMLLVWWLLRR